ncbi:MAG: DUF1990 domain-containing protein [Acidobacteriota bacterium]
MSIYIEFTLIKGLCDNLFVFMLHKPSDEEVRNFIAVQARLPFSYMNVGATKGHNAPDGYPVNRYRKELGKGRKTYASAAKALYSWQMYSLDWTQIHPLKAAIKEGETVVVLAKHFGFFWSLNPCRVIYLIDEENEDVQRCGFAFGTLPAHSEEGEEQFVVERDKNNDAVWYELYAFAKPKNILAKIGSPVVHHIQKQFAAESSKAMLNAVNRAEIEDK